MKPNTVLIKKLNNVKESLNDYENGVVSSLTNLSTELKQVVKYDNSVEDLSEIISSMIMQLQEIEIDIEARLSGDVGAYGNELDDMPRDENRGINTLQYMLPVAQTEEEIEEEPEEMSFYERLRQNLGLV